MLARFFGMDVDPQRTNGQHQQVNKSGQQGKIDNDDEDSKECGTYSKMHNETSFLPSLYRRGAVAATNYGATRRIFVLL